VSDTTITRRQNALVLFKAYAEKALAEGAAPTRFEQAFAATLEISASQNDGASVCPTYGWSKDRRSRRECNAFHPWTRRFSNMS